MAGPWEKYASQSANPSEGPWSKYGKSTPVPDEQSILQKIKDKASSYANTAVDELPQIGGAVGGVLGLPEGGVGAIPGAALGGAAGTALQKLIRGYQNQGMGYFTNAPTLEGTGQASADLAGGALQGIGGEMAGQGIGGAINMAKPYAKAGIAKGSELLTGVPKQAFNKLIENPQAVMHNYSPEESLGIAQKAQDELLANQAASKLEMQTAKKAFGQNYGATPVDTSELLSNNLAKRQSSLPNEQGIGAISPKEAAQLSDLEKRGLMTKVQDPNFPNDPNKFTYQPQVSGRRLQQFADHINANTNLADSQKLNANSPDTPYTASMKQMYGSTKNVMHNISPELAAADAKANQFLTDSAFLDKLAKDKQMESFINTFYGKNKELMRQNADQIIPNSVPDIENLAASRSFNPTSETGSGGALGKRVHAGNAAVFTGAGATISSHNPLPLIGGIAAKTAMDPQVVKQVVGNGAKLSGWLEQNPEILKLIQSSTGQAVTSPWLQVPGGTNQ